MVASSLLLLVIITGLTGAFSEVIELDEANFDTFVNGEHFVLLEFYAPW